MFNNNDIFEHVRTGRRYRISREGDGCHPLFVLLLLLIPVIVILGILGACVYLWAGVTNLVQHRPLDWSPSSATATTKAARHFEIGITNARIIGNAHLFYPSTGFGESPVIWLSKGGSAEFDNIFVDGQGDFTLTISTNWDSIQPDSDRRISVVVNGKPETKMIISNQTLPQPAHIQLHMGKNTIKLTNETDDYCYANGDCTNIGIRGITVDGA